MRVGVLSVLAALLAIAVVVVLWSAPFADVKATSTSGESLRDDRLGFQEFHDERAIARADGEPVETVTGTGYLYMLVPAIALAAMGLVFLLGHLIPGRAGDWTIATGGIGAAISAILVLHSNALWAGKGVASLATNNALGSDAPPRIYRNMIREFSPVDMLSHFTPISPFIIIAITIAFLAVLGMAWSRALPDERSLRPAARRQGWLVATTGALLGIVLMVPMVVQTLPDGLPAEGDDQDTFVFSAHHVLFMREVSWEFAAQSNEPGLVLWDGLSILLGLTIAVLMIAAMGPALGLLGKHLEAMGHAVGGRLLENLSLVAIIGAAMAIVTSVLVAFVLAAPNDVFDADTTGVPLIAGLAGLAVGIHGILVARHVLADASGDVADDFPEPVVYE